MYRKYQETRRVKSETVQFKVMSSKVIDFFALLSEIELDPKRTFCPAPNCSTAVNVSRTSKRPAKCPVVRASFHNWSIEIGSIIVSCFQCKHEFCAICKLEFHEGQTCDQQQTRVTPAGVFV